MTALFFGCGKNASPHRQERSPTFQVAFTNHVAEADIWLLPLTDSQQNWLIRILDTEHRFCAAGDIPLADCDFELVWAIIPSMEVVK